ncbi:DUF397 domain-containing protein [Catenulispora pinisilvae]|uniref:DUF397 domain-containing protein n=1 Tax=Catenulispora pinisilvae TaxID=2705253 RepID=UPI001E33FBDF|nr:DUF397 domain-containing protein [Catenulispora pinisilvae]
MSKEELYAAYELLESSLKFQKSTYSSDTGSCVEVADLPDGAKALRDSVCPNRPALVFSADEWVAFVHGVADGQFD